MERNASIRLRSKSEQSKLNCQFITELEKTKKRVYLKRLTFKRIIEKY